MTSARTAATLAILTVGAVVLGLTVGDASALRGETTVDTSLGTSRVNGATASLADPVTVSVLGEGWLEERVEERLVDALRERGATVQRVGTVGPSVDGPVLVVGVTVADVDFSPIRPSGSVAVAFAYVRPGNATLARSIAAGEPVVVRGSADAYVVGGEVRATDRAQGLATRPAYRNRLAAALADGIVGALEDAPGMHQPS